MKQSSSSPPRVAFVIDLGCDGATDHGHAGIGRLAQLFRGLGLPVTWAVVGAGQARYLGHSEGGLANPELALALHTVDHYSPKRFLAALGSRVAALRDSAGTGCSLVVGNVTELRKRASVLADNGIGAILSSPSTLARPAAPRPLACGLWQLHPSWDLPLPRRHWRSLLPGPSIARAIVAAGATIGTTVAVISAAQLERGSTRRRQMVEKRLREVARAASDNQLAVVSLSEVVSQLASQRKITPQRSILRRAA